MTRGPDYEHKVQYDVEAVPDEHGEGEEYTMVSQHTDAALESLQTRLRDPELVMRC